MLSGPVSEHFSSVLVKYFHSLSADFAKTCIYRLVEIRDVVPLNHCFYPQVFVLVGIIIHTWTCSEHGIKILRHHAFKNFSYTDIFPQIIRIRQNLPLFIAHANGAVRLPCFRKCAFINDVGNPVGININVDAQAPLVRAGRSDDDIVVKDVSFVVPGPVKSCASTPEQRLLSEMFSVIIRIEFCTLRVDGDEFSLSERVAFFAHLNDAL